MTRDEALTQLTEAGEDAGSDFNDGIDAYFSWRVVAPATFGEPCLLEIMHQSVTVDAAADAYVYGEHEVFRFRLVPVE